MLLCTTKGRLLFETDVAQMAMISVLTHLLRFLATITTKYKTVDKINQYIGWHMCENCTTLCLFLLLLLFLFRLFVKLKLEV